MGMDEEGDISRLRKENLEEHPAWSHLLVALQRQFVPHDILLRVKHCFKRVRIGIDEMFPKS